MDEPTRPTPESADEQRRRDHLRLVTMSDEQPAAAPARPRSIGRLIAQTALIADGAVARRRDESRTPMHRGGLAGRLLGRMR